MEDIDVTAAACRLPRCHHLQPERLQVFGDVIRYYKGRYVKCMPFVCVGGTGRMRGRDVAVEICRT